METSKRVGILGYGEIGKAIATFYQWDQLYIEDKAAMTTLPTGLELDILHVCIPCPDADVFVAVVRDVVRRHARGGVVIIHSTVPVGTTARVAEELNPHVVHSPVRGVHPHLAEGIKTFTKFIGADFSGAGRLAAEHLEGLGIHAVVLHKSKTTELLKLLDTTYYGLAIAYHDYAQQLCEREGVNFDMVMTEANRSYNEGYAKLGKPEVVRPVLRPLIQFGEDRKIGGHCVIPNADILREQFGEDPLLDAILRHK